MKKYDLIVWDWNGTLLDDVYIALEAVNRTLRKRNMNEIDIEQYYSFVDMPIIRFYEHIFDLDKVPFSVLSKEFTEFTEAQESNLKLHDGVIEKLQDFKCRGCRQIIVSAAHIEQIKYYLEKFGIAEYFEAVLGADDFLAESKIERAEKYFAENDINSESALLIGDCIHDFDTAQAIGCECVLVSCGHQSKTDLQKTGCKVFDNIDKIKL